MRVMSTTAGGLAAFDGASLAATWVSVDHPILMIRASGTRSRRSRLDESVALAAFPALVSRPQRAQTLLRGLW